MQGKADHRVKKGGGTRINLCLLLHMHQDTPLLSFIHSTTTISAATMANPSFIAGIIGNITSLLVYLAPIATFWRVIKKKSTENFKGLPYITAVLATALWTFYGVLKPGGLLVATVNGIGAFIHIIYVVLYLIYAPKELKAKAWILTAILDVGFPEVVIAASFLAIHGKFQLVFVGVLCAGVAIGRYGSPLSIMRTVIRTKSVKYMPFFLSFFLFINAGAWTICSILVKDYYLGVPNAIGFILGLAQLIIYASYRKKSGPVKSEEKKDEDDSTQMLKRGVQMGVHDEDGKTRPKNHRLINKGRSLPTPSMSGENSLRKTMKTLSLSPYELHSSWQQNKDVENATSKMLPKFTVKSVV